MKLALLPWIPAKESQSAMKTFLSRTSLIAVTLLLLAPIAPYAVDGVTGKPQPKVIQLDTSGNGDLPLLKGPPESVKMKSAPVVLAPGRSVGKHSTGQNEELLVVFEGQGAMTFKDRSKLPVKPNSALYCPPETEHNVTNTGPGQLRYIYIVANTR
jgi:mannose-6-phosphate isomerase-like protein (cupin superfamily)